MTWFRDDDIDEEKDVEKFLHIIPKSPS